MIFRATIELGGRTATGLQVPADLDAALAGDSAARAFFDGLAYTHRREGVRWIEQAKKPETRSARLTATVEALRAGRRTR